MQKGVLLSSERLEITLHRLCRTLLENHRQFDNTVIIGLQPRGKVLAERIHKKLESMEEVSIPIGFLDATFYRDDFRQRSIAAKVNSTDIPFLVENKRVVLIDDVLYTGRSVRSALDALQAYGRPSKIELLVLVDRLYTRQIPVEANYVGVKVNSMISQRVTVEWKAEGSEADQVWLIDDAS